MKKVLFISLALLMNQLTATASKPEAMSPLDTLQVYTINGETISDFDGSQLAHKHITNYQMNVSPVSANGKEVIQTHDIKTPTDPSPLIILDGKVIPTIGNMILNKLDPSNIKSIDVIKDNNKQEELFRKYLGKYDEETRKKYQGIIIITSINKEKNANACQQLSKLKSQLTKTATLPQSYIIDGKKVKNFDGSQLKGKNIEDYKINIDTIAHTKNSLVTTHHITIDKSIHIRGTKQVQSSLKKQKAEPKYILNGRPSSKEEISKLSPTVIKGMTVLKAGSKAAEQYSSEHDDAHDYILITTKK